MKSFTVPKHCAIIMDGNGRWAKKRGLPRPMGHRQGAKTTHTIIEAAIAQGVSYLTLYVFSAENWKRPKTEVTLLMKLLVEMIKKELPNLMAKNVRVLNLGDITLLPEFARSEYEAALAQTANNTGMTLLLAVSYGGRAEIVAAAQQYALSCIENGSVQKDMTEEAFTGYLCQPNIPDPELIIRTGGDQRISNFLLWQAAYAELFFTDTLWPDFNEDGLVTAFKAFSTRERRFGKVSQE